MGGSFLASRRKSDIKANMAMGACKFLLMTSSVLFREIGNKVICWEVGCRSYEDREGVE